MTARSLPDRLDLPTLRSAQVGDIVTGHFCGLDRTARIEAIRGEMALVFFDLASGGCGRQWVRSHAPQVDMETAAADEAAYAAYLAAQLREHDEMLDAQEEAL